METKCAAVTDRWCARAAKRRRKQSTRRKIVQVTISMTRPSGETATVRATAADRIGSSCWSLFAAFPSRAAYCVAQGHCNLALQFICIKFNINAVCLPMCEFAFVWGLKIYAYTCKVRIYFCIFCVWHTINVQHCVYDIAIDCTLHDKKVVVDVFGYLAEIPKTFI